MHQGTNQRRLPMRIKHVLSTLLLSGMTIAGWVGCQTSDSLTSSSLSTSQTGELFLAVDTTDSCAGLKAALVSGTAADSMSFAKECITRVPSKPKPPLLPPDSGTRCIWIKNHIDSGEVALVPIFAADHKTLCDSLKVADTTSFNEYCKLPPPPPPKAGGKNPPPSPKDSARAAGDSAGRP